MKSRILSLFALAIFTSMLLHGQTSIEIVYADDSLFSSHCPTPQAIPFMLGGSCSGYNPTTDFITIEVNFGDGNDTSFQVGIINGYYDDYFNAYLFYHTYYFAGSYSVKYIAIGPDGNSDTLIHDDEVVVSDTCGNVSGLVYLDTNGDCVFDNNDIAEYFFPVHLYENGNYVESSYTDANGYYWFSVPNGSAFDIVVDTPLYLPNGYVPSCPGSGTYSITAPSSGNDFGFSCDTAVYFSYDLYGAVDYSLTGVKLSQGKIGYLHPFVANHSCIPATGTAKLVISDPVIHYLSSTPPPDLVSGDTLMWNFTAFNNYSFWNFWNYTISTVSFQTDSFAAIGDTVCFMLIIEPVTGDQNPADNIVIYCDTIRAPYDPNFKAVIPPGKGEQGYIPPNTELTYTIHFQNTGTALAENVFILDTLDTDLDIATFHPLMSSHPVTFDLLGSIVKFSFNNIQLPDSGSNEAQSSGSVSYSIQMKEGLSDGTQITNEAGIYFDFNPVVMTNQTLNTIDLSSGIDNSDTITNFFLVFPNPASDNITLQFSEPSGKLTVRNATGDLLISKQVSSMEMNLDISTLPNGIYLIFLQDDKGICSRKFIVVR